MDEFQIIIVGAGISGCVLAERYANILDKNVLVIEKRNHIGGNCFDHLDKYKVLIHKYGPHFFHTNNQKVWNYISQFTKWHFYEHRVLSYVDNIFVPVPVNINTINALFRANISTPKEMKDWLKKETLNIKNEKNSEEVALTKFGKKLYEKLFKKYTLKQWGMHPKKIDPSVMRRISIHYSYDDRYFTDKYQAIPKDGYNSIFKKMLNSKKIKLILNTDFFKFKKNIKNFEKLFYSGPLDSYFQFKYGKLRYRSLYFKKKNLKTDFYQQKAQINYPNDYDFTRITEFKHATGQKVNSTTIMYEYPRWRGEPFYPVLDDRNRKKLKLYQQKINQLKKQNIYFIGRLANYIYINMDTAFANALNLFDAVK